MILAANEALSTDLCDALLARGFDIRAAVRVTGYGDHKIATIKQVREINTKIGLRDAKNAVEGSKIVLRNASLTLAEQACAKLHVVGGAAEVLPSHGFRYVFDPKHPQRGAQPCTRVEIRAGQLELRHAQLGSWAEAEPAQTRFGPDDDQALLDAYDALRQRWAEDGLREATSETELLLALCARNPELERSFDDAASDTPELAAAAAVYADWLLEQGDPRGQLGAAQLATTAASGTEFEALLEAWAPHVLGPFHALRESWNLDWCGPLVTHVDLRAPEGIDPHALLESSLGLPVMAAVRHLQIRGECADHPELGRLLDQATCAGTVRTLELGRSRLMMLRGAQLPRLERLRTDTGYLPRFELDAPELRSFHCSSNWYSSRYALDEAFAGLDAPQLQHLYLELSYGPQWQSYHGPFEPQMRRMFALPCFGRLVTLTLSSVEDGPLLQPDFVDMLRSSPAMATLVRIDLRGLALGDEARAQLARARDELPELWL